MSSYPVPIDHVDEESPLLLHGSTVIPRTEAHFVMNYNREYNNGNLNKAMNIVHIASECVPFVWGGLGHAVSGIANAEVNAGHNVAVVLPYSPYLKTHGQGLHVVADFDIELPYHGPTKKHHCVVFQVNVHQYESNVVGAGADGDSGNVATNVPPDSTKGSKRKTRGSPQSTKQSTSLKVSHSPSIYFIHHPLLNGKDIYAYGDSESMHYISMIAALQFIKTILFPCDYDISKGLTTSSRHSREPVDIIHFHDWICGLGPFLMQKDKYFARYHTASVFTIHNGAYQGLITIEEGMQYGLDSFLFHEPVTLQGQISMLRLGIMFADKVTTVSPTYRLEMMRSEQGLGNEDMLRVRARDGDFLGIVNGIDIEEWNPAIDNYLTHKFDVNTFIEGKKANKLHLQHMFQFIENPEYPLLVICSRITKQKGIHLLMDHIPFLIERYHLQVVVLGNASQTDIFGKELVGKLQSLCAVFPQYMMYQRYDSQLEHLAIASADIFFMASLFEPCGLAHQHAARYGAVMVGTKVGGLCDTTVNYSADPKKATAFLSSSVDARAIEQTLQLALNMYINDRQQWNKLAMNAMTRDASWELICPQYIELYKDAKSKRFMKEHQQHNDRTNHDLTGEDNYKDKDGYDIEEGISSTELSRCHSCMMNTCCSNKWITFDVELFYAIPSLFHACKTTPARNDFLYVIFKTSLINLAARSYLIMVSLEDGDLELPYAILSLVWYQLQDCVFTIFGQTYMKFLGKLGPLVKIYHAEFGDLCFVLVILFIFEFSNRLILGPLNGNYAAYTWQGILTIWYNLLQGIISSGPVDPTINKLRTRGIISHTTAMHIFQIMGLSLLFGLLATFGYQTLHAIVMVTQFTIFSSIYLCLIIFKNPAARLRNAYRSLKYIFCFQWMCCDKNKDGHGTAHNNQAPTSMYDINLSVVDGNASYYDNSNKAELGSSKRHRSSSVSSASSSSTSMSNRERSRSIGEYITQTLLNPTLSSSSTATTFTSKYYPSPKNWNDEILYSILIDRFNLGRDENLIPSSQVVLDGHQRHGGDLQGIIKQLNYLQELGITTLLLSPIVTNSEFVMKGIESYHGYSPIHLLEVDPRIGTLSDFQSLVKQCHERGIRVVLDFPLNHVANVFEYVDNNDHDQSRSSDDSIVGGTSDKNKRTSQWVSLDQPPKPIQWQQDLKPVELMHQDHFICHGVIDDWKNTDQSLYGDFPPNFRKLATNRKETQDILLNILRYWIKETDIDGYRIDAAKHLNVPFLQRIDSEIREYASLCNKENFLLLLEHSSGMDEEIVPYLWLSTDRECNNSNHQHYRRGDTTDSDCDRSQGQFYAYNYPDFRRVNAALHGESASRELEISFWKNQMCFGNGNCNSNGSSDETVIVNAVAATISHDDNKHSTTSVSQQPQDTQPAVPLVQQPTYATAAVHDHSYMHNLVRFIDNHDVFRFLRDSSTDDIDLLYIAIGYLLFSIGLPMIYYGTEQYFAQAYSSVLEVESVSNPADPNNRKNMFQPRVFDPMTMEEVPQTFNNTLPIYLYIRQLIDIRKQYLVLSRGEQVIRYSDPSGPGLFIFSRIYQNEEIIIALNTSTSAKTVTIALGSGNSSSSNNASLAIPNPSIGTEFQDVLDTAYIVTIGPTLLPVSTVKAGSMTITVPKRGRHGIRVLMKREVSGDY